MGSVGGKGREEIVFGSFKTTIRSDFHVMRMLDMISSSGFKCW